MGDLLLGALALMLVIEGLLPFLSPRRLARDLRARDADERRADPLRRPEQHADRLALLLLLLALSSRRARCRRGRVRRYNAAFNPPVRFMSSAWLLPEHIADVLPSQARRIEELRRSLLDRARGYGFELVMPPLLEHLESLLSGTGHELDLKTFKLVDQLSGRTLGLRADTTPQVARIDAHLLNRDGVTRLCYCGPVLHTRPDGLRRRASRCSSAPRSSAMPASKPTSKCSELALDCLRSAPASTDVVHRPGRRACAARRARRRRRSTPQQLHEVVRGAVGQGRCRRCDA